MKKASRAIRSTNWNTRQPDELKYVDTAFANYLCDTAGTVTLINPLAAGAGVDQRVGRQAYMRYVNVGGMISPVGVLATPARSDVYVIYDRQPSGALPNINTILQANETGSQLNLEYRERYVVIAHETYVIGAPQVAGPSISPNVHAVSIAKRFNLRTTFIADAAAIASISSGALYLVTIGNVAAGAAPTLRARVRVRYSEF